MPELLFEIATEELPALAIEPSAAFMRDFLSESLAKLRLKHSAIAVAGTPRRLVAMIDDLAKKQEDLEEEILGPSTQIAFDAAGNFTQAGQGFLRAKGVLEADCYRKKTDKGEVIAAKKRTSGALTKDLLPAVLTELLHKIPFKNACAGIVLAIPFRAPFVISLRFLMAHACRCILRALSRLTLPPVTAS